MTRGGAARALPFDLDTAIQRVSQDAPDHAGRIQLTGVFHNLLRRRARVQRQMWQA